MVGVWSTGGMIMKSQCPLFHQKTIIWASLKLNPGIDVEGTASNNLNSTVNM
jgi:hypothetical protein